MAARGFPKEEPLKAPVLKARVLVIDDDESFLAAIRHGLEASFREVHCAAGEAEGWALLEKNAYDLVLLDLLLGGEPAGLRICRRLKNDPRWRDVPVLVVSAADMLYGLSLKSYLADEQCLPAEDFVDKVAGPAEIVKRARRIVERPTRADKSAPE